MKKNNTLTRTEYQHAQSINRRECCLMRELIEQSSNRSKARKQEPRVTRRPTQVIMADLRLTLFHTMHRHSMKECVECARINIPISKYISIFPNAAGQADQPRCEHDIHNFSALADPLPSPSSPHLFSQEGRCHLQPGDPFFPF